MIISRHIILELPRDALARLDRSGLSKCIFAPRRDSGPILVQSIWPSVEYDRILSLLRGEDGNAPIHADIHLDHLKLDEEVQVGLPLNEVVPDRDIEFSYTRQWLKSLDKCKSCGAESWPSLGAERLPVAPSSLRGRDILQELRSNSLILSARALECLRDACGDNLVVFPILNPKTGDEIEGYVRLEPSLVQAKVNDYTRTRVISICELCSRPSDWVLRSEIYFDALPAKLPGVFKLASPGEAGSLVGKLHPWSLDWIGVSGEVATAFSRAKLRGLFLRGAFVAPFPDLLPWPMWKP